MYVYAAGLSAALAADGAVAGCTQALPVVAHRLACPMYVCVCVHIHIYIYIYMYVYVYIYIYIYMYTYNAIV